MKVILVVTCFNFLVDIIDDLVSQLILGDDEHGKSKQDGGNDAYQPQDTLFGKWSLDSLLGIEANVRQHQSGNDTTQCHAGLEEDTCQGVDNTRDALACGVLTIGNNLRNKCPHVTGGYDDTRRLDELCHIDYPHL